MLRGAGLERRRFPGVLAAELVPASGQAPVRAYDKTCPWTGASPNTVIFNGVEGCENLGDDGNIPGGGPGPTGATADSLIEGVTFGHVTFAPPRTLDVELLFYNALGGACVGSALPHLPLPAAQGALLLNAANGVPLPGDPTAETRPGS